MHKVMKLSFFASVLSKKNSAGGPKNSKKFKPLLNYVTELNSSLVCSLGVEIIADLYWGQTDTLD